MSLIKKIFCFNTDDNSAIGLCKFSDEMKLSETRQVIKKRIKKDETLTQMLKRSL